MALSEQTSTAGSQNDDVKSKTGPVSWGPLRAFHLRLPSNKVLSSMSPDENMICVTIFNCFSRDKLFETSIIRTVVRAHLNILPLLPNMGGLSTDNIMIHVLVKMLPTFDQYLCSAKIRSSQLR